jgi:hypothetical protein
LSSSSPPNHMFVTRNDTQRCFYTEAPPKETN